MIYLVDVLDCELSDVWNVSRHPSGTYLQYIPGTNMDENINIVGV